MSGIQQTANLDVSISGKNYDEKKCCNYIKKKPSMPSIIKKSGFFDGKGAQKKAFDDRPDAKFFVCYEQEYKPDKYTRTYRGFDSADDFMSFQHGIDKKDRRFHEILTGEIVEAYDIDASYALPHFQDADGNPLPDQDILDNFFEAREDFGNANKYNNYEVDIDKDVYIKRTDDPEKKKASFHIIIRNGYKFKNFNQAKKYMIQFNTYITENNLNVLIDNSLYANNKTLRILHSHKGGQPNRIAERYPDFNKGTTLGEAKLFLVSYLQGNEEYISLTEDEDITVEVPLQVEYLPVEDGEVKRLVDLICNSIDEGKHSLCKTNAYTKNLCYIDWWRLAMTIINCSDDYNYAGLFKKVYNLYRHNKEIDQDTKLDKMYQDKGKYSKLTINTLRYYARENPKYKELFPEHIKCDINNKQKYIYNKMLKKRKKRIQTIEEDYKYIYNLKDSSKEVLFLNDYKSILKRVIVNVCNGANPIIKTFNSTYDTTSKSDIDKWETTKYKKLKESGGYLYRQVSVINENYIEEFNEYNDAIKKDPDLVKELIVPRMIYKVFLGDEGQKGGIFRDMFMNGELTTYDKVVFQPYLHPQDVHVREQDFNVFQTFPFYKSFIEERMSSDNFESSIFRKHVRDILCDGDERLFNYMEQYIARMMQKPFERPDTAPIFTGAQGVGKDMFVHCLSNLIGKDKTLILGSMDSLLKGFNMQQEGKLLVVVNEISDKGAHINKHDQLKHQITQDYINIEPKGIDSYSVKHVANYFGFSNKENILKVESTERRFLLIKTNNSVANNHVYFKPIWEQIEDIDFLKSMMTYYCTLDITNFVVRDLPETQYKNEQKILNLSNPLSFVLDMCKEELEYNVGFDADGNAKIHTQDLYKKFELWCLNSGTIKNSRKNFISDLKSLGLVEYSAKFSMKGAMGHTTKRSGYHLNISNIEQYYKRLMNNQDFSFTTGIIE